MGLFGKKKDEKKRRRAAAEVTVMPNAWLRPIR